MSANNNTPVLNVPSAEDCATAFSAITKAMAANVPCANPAQFDGALELRELHHAALMRLAEQCVDDYTGCPFADNVRLMTLPGGQEILGLMVRGGAEHNHNGLCFGEVRLDGVMVYDITDGEQLPYHEADPVYVGDCPQLMYLLPVQHWVQYLLQVQFNKDWTEANARAFCAGVLDGNALDWDNVQAAVTGVCPPTYDGWDDGDPFGDLDELGARDEEAEWERERALGEPDLYYSDMDPQFWDDGMGIFTDDTGPDNPGPCHACEPEPLTLPDTAPAAPAGLWDPLKAAVDHHGMGTYKVPR